MNAQHLYQRWHNLYRDYIDENTGKFDPELLFQHFLPTFSQADLQIMDRDAVLEIGLSRLDGLPDLLEGVEWPQQNGKSLDFVAQIRLQDLEPGFHPLLPEVGWLAFFVGDPYGQGSIPHSVVFFDGPKDQLVRTRPPSHLQPPDQIGARTALIRFVASFTMDPDYYWQIFFDQIESKTRPEHSDTLPPVDKCLPETTRIGGYGYGFQGGNPDQDARLALNGFPLMVQYHYLYLAQPSPYESEHEHRERFRKMRETVVAAGKEQALEQEVQRYERIKDELDEHLAPVEMLFGLESVLGRIWGDAGFLQFFIRQDDLRNRNFEHTFCDLICT